MLENPVIFLILILITLAIAILILYLLRHKNNDTRDNGNCQETIHQESLTDENPLSEDSPDEYGSGTGDTESSDSSDSGDVDRDDYGSGYSDDIDSSDASDDVPSPKRTLSFADFADYEPKDGNLGVKQQVMSKPREKRDISHQGKDRKGSVEDRVCAVFEDYSGRYLAVSIRHDSWYDCDDIIQVSPFRFKSRVFRRVICSDSTDIVPSSEPEPVYEVPEDDSSYLVDDYF